MRYIISIQRIRVIAVLAILAPAAVFVLSSPPAGASQAAAPEPAATPRRQPRQPRRPRTTRAQEERPAKPRRYTEFPHGVKQHRQTCGACHKFPTANWGKARPKDAFPDVTDFPEHASCLDCHRQQFFKGTPPAICSVCHTTPGPRSAARHPFPNPRETFDLTARGKRAVSDFTIYFPHDKHEGLVGRIETSAPTAGFVKASHRPRAAAAAAAESCAVCHQTLNAQNDSDQEFYTKPPANLGDGFWLKRGTFKSSPTSHAACFSCHSTDTGIVPAPSDCAACHKPAASNLKSDFVPPLAAAMSVDERQTILAWRERDTSKFRHEWFSHQELACATCHDTAAMNTALPATKKVKILSCGGAGSGCHITPTSDDGGALNFEIDARRKDAEFECVKCHTSFGEAAIPASHEAAVSALAPK